MLLVTSLLLGVWLGWQELPREIARWYLAAAVEHRANYDYSHLHSATVAEPERELSNEAIDFALKWDPKNAEAYLLRAQWAMKDRRFDDAHNDCARAQEHGADEMELLQVRVALMGRLGRFSEGVKDQLRLRELLTEYGYHDKETLNGIAYYRALAGTDLETAIQEVNQSLEGLPRVVRRDNLDAADAVIRRLDTRGFIYYRMRRFKEAADDFELAGRLANERMALWRTNRPNELKAAREVRDFELHERERIHEQYGVIYYHRSLVLEKLNRWKEAQHDRRIAKDLLGREPDESVF